MKVAWIKPYGIDHEVTPKEQQYLCKMNDGTMLTVMIPVTFRGNDKNRAVRFMARLKWENVQWQRAHGASGTSGT